MSAAAKKEFGLFPPEAAEGAEQIKIHQRVIRVTNSRLLPLGIRGNEERGNVQNLDMAEQVMKAMELHSSSRDIQVCWMNYPRSYEQKSVDLVYIRFPFTLDSSVENVLVRLQTEENMGAKLQESILSRLENPSTHIETSRQLLAPNAGSTLDLSSMKADHCVHIQQSVFEIAKEAYTANNPKKTYERNRQIIIRSGEPVVIEDSKTGLLPLGDFVDRSIFFRVDPEKNNRLHNSE